MLLFKFLIGFTLILTKCDFNEARQTSYYWDVEVVERPADLPLEFQQTVMLSKTQLNTVNHLSPHHDYLFAVSLVDEVTEKVLIQ